MAPDQKKLSTDSYKGVRDFYPEDQAVQNFMFATLRKVVEAVGYVEYGASILEPSELYKSKGAENEEMVNEQTYTFTDRGGREVTLRPEMTPTVARMVSAKRREFGFPLRLYSIPNVFRYERTQKGRLREHWQLNVDIFGSKSIFADAEILGVAYGIMRSFGAKESDFVIKVGSRVFLNELIQKKGLDEVSAGKLIRLLDSKDKMSAETFEAGLAELGLTTDILSTENIPTDIKEILQKFKDENVHNIVYDPSIVRGFAYYTGMVFEVYDTDPNNNRALFGGGRYDNLTELFDDEKVPGVGFGMGDVTLREFLLTRNLIPAYVPPTQVYLAITSPELAFSVQSFAGAHLRSKGVSVAIDFGEKKLADQIRMASKHKIPYLIVIGDNELKQNLFVVRDMNTGIETNLTKEELPAFFNK